MKRASRGRQAWAPHRVPSGVHLLLLELGKLTPVMNDHQKLPDEQQGQTDEHDPRNHPSYDGHDLRAGGALWGGGGFTN